MEPLSPLQNLMKRVYLPPQIQEDLKTTLPADQAETVNRALVAPLLTASCPETQRPFICCEFNEYSKGHRSPYSNIYVPNVGGPAPSKALREMELKALQQFEDYCVSFYKKAICSVYIKETSDRSYAMCFAVKTTRKTGENDIVHTIDLIYDGHSKIVFKLFTKYLLISKDNGQDLTVSLAKTVEEPVNRQDVVKQEISHMIKMIESVESNLKRSVLNFVQCKPLQTIQLCRFLPENTERKRDLQVLKDLWTDKSFKENEHLRKNNASS